MKYSCVQSLIGLCSVLLLVACNGYYAPQPLRIVGSQKEFQHFHLSLDSNYLFLTSEKKINFLSLEKATIGELKSTVPMPLDFEKIRGKKDTIFVQTSTGIKFFKNGLNAWEEFANIDDVKPCDDFLIIGKILLVAKGNSICRNNSEMPAIALYDLSNPKAPVLKYAYGLSDTGIPGNPQMEVYQNNILLLTQEGLSVLELSEGKLTKIATNPALKGIRLTVFEARKIAFLSNEAGVQQLSLKNLKNIQVLSTLQ